MQVDRLQTIDVELKSREILHITPISDLHLDSSLCEYDTLKGVLTERNAQYSNHRVIVIGDMTDLLLPVDPRRYRRSLDRTSGNRDDFLSERIDEVIERLKGLGSQIDLIGEGNHEHAAVKHHGIDPTSIIAHALGARRGGYHGMLAYRLIDRDAVRSSCYIAYHHGAWGGEYAKGYLGASRWFGQMEGWDLALYGHNHALRHDPEVRFHATTGGIIRERTVHILNVGSWAKRGHDDARLTSYADMRGMRAHPRLAPLVRVTHVRAQGGKGDTDSYHKRLTVEL